MLGEAEGLDQKEKQRPGRVSFRYPLVVILRFTTYPKKNPFVASISLPHLREWETNLYFFRLGRRGCCGCNATRRQCCARARQP